MAVFVGLLLVAVVVGVSLMAARSHDPRDLSYWSRVAGSRDWSLAAAQGDSRAQCLLGLSLIRTNILTRGIARVPGLSSLPIIGKRYFERISYDLGGRVAAEQLADAQRWIKESADHGFAPAKEAQKLFIGKTGTLNKGSAATGSQPIGSDTNQTPSAVGSRH